MKHGSRKWGTVFFDVVVEFCCLSGFVKNGITMIVFSCRIRKDYTSVLKDSRQIVLLRLHGRCNEAANISAAQ